MPSTNRQVSDPKILRAIAHPVRNRILTELSAGGPMRAVDLAAELDLPANQISFHLRQLAKYGLVVEAPEAARDRRDRVWRSAAEDGVRVELDEIAKQPGGRAAAEVFRRHRAEWGHVVVDAVYDNAHREPGTLRTVTESAVRLTKEEATEMAAELDALVERWAERTRGRDADRRTYLWFSVLQPHPEQSSESE